MINVQNDACFGLSLTLCTSFKICSQFSKIAIFEKVVKIPFLKKNVNFFNVFQCRALICSHNEFVENLVNDKTFLKKCVFTFFTPKTKHYQITT